MRRFLLLLSILCSVFISKVQAQLESRLTAPKNVCLNSYATMHAFLNSSTPEVMVNWTITYPDGTVLNHRYDQQGNYPGGHHPDFRYMDGPEGQSVTFDVKQVGKYTVTVTIQYYNGTVLTTSQSRTQQFDVYDCSMDECEGTFTPSTNFKETFGTFNPGDPRRQVAAPATITYNFRATGELTDDQYSIYYNARLGGKAQWDNVDDHTDNGYGGMLIANSSDNPKLFYRRPVNNLCPGAKYNFSAWFINLNSLEVLNDVCQREDYRYAGVTFIVRNATDNSIIKQFNTNDVSMDLSRNLPGDQRLTGWQQFGGTVTLAPGEENVIVEIMNNNPGGCGNDIAVDDIEFVFCAPKIYSYIDGLGVDNDMVCPGAELNITSKIEPSDYFADPVYIWEMNKNGGGWGPITEPGYTYPDGDSILHIGPGVLQEEDYIQYRLYVFERNNVNTRGCYTPGNMVTISVPRLPTILASRPRICRGDTTTLTASPLEGPGITGYETFQFTGPNILTWPTLPVPKDKVMVTPVVTSTYEVTGSIQYGQYGNGQPRVCHKEASINILVDQPPTVNLGPDHRVCTNQQVTLDAGAANTAYSIQWTPTSATTQTITINAPGVSSTQAYRVAVTNGECTVRDTVNVTAVAYPDAVITSQAAFCNTNPVPLVAVTPDPGYTGEWTIVGNSYGATIDDPTSPDNALLLNMPFDQPVRVRWTVTATGTNCSDYAEQDVIRESRPVSTPGSSQTSCSNVFQLAANAPANSTMQGTWSVTGGGTATFGDIHDPNTTATITSAVGTTVTIAWTMAKLNSPSACGPDTKTITIRQVPPPTLTINSTDISSCRGAGGFYRFEIPYTQTNAQTYSLQAVGPNPLPGFSNTTNAAFVTPLRVSYPASTPPGTYTFRMVARRTNLAVCETEAFFSVRIETPSTLSSVSSNENTICIGNSVTLTVTGTLGSNAQWVWYAGGCGSGAPVATGASVTLSPTASTTYYVRAESNGPCANTACGSVSVTVNQRPAYPDAGADQEQCNSSLFVLDAVTPNIGTGTWILPAGVTIVSGGINNPKATVSVPAGMSAALGWTVTIGKCVVGPDTVIITNLAPITNNVIEEDQLICSGSQPAAITSVGTPTGGNGTYSYSWQYSTTSATAGFINIGGAAGPNYQPPALTQTTWYRRVVTSGASCTSTSDPVRIMISTAVPNIVSTPPDTSVQCYTGRDYTIYFGTPQFDHPEGLPVTVTHADVVTPAACGQTITRTWTATDSCNKTTTTSQTITVIDTIKPKPVGPTPADTTVSCDAIPAPLTFPMSDNCSAAANIDSVFTETRVNGACANGYQLVREWRLIDECGNDTIIRQRVNVIDTTNPRVVGIAPRDTTVSCDAIPVPATFQVSDNCSAAANVDTVLTETRINGVCANTYQIVREWTLTDECGNDTIIRQRINVIDTTRPRVVGIAPRDTTVSCSAVPAPATFQVSDNCSVPANVDTIFTETRINGACANTYQLVRQWRLIDECGNDTIVRQQINVIDTTNPRVVGIAPRDTTVSCSAVPAPATFQVSDNCSAAANIDTVFSQTRINGACANSYQLIRQWVITDECGNDTIIRQRINVIDTTNPRVVGIAPRDTTVSCSAVPAPATFQVSDNCSAAANIDTVFTQTRINGTCANTYQLVREWRLTDECGNDTIIRQRINVVDTTNPRVVGIAPGDTTVSCSAVPAPATFQVSDNCSAATNIDTVFSQTRIDGTCANSYQLIRQWVITDECGNDTIIRQRINVVDTTNPRVVGIAPKDTTVSCSAVPAPATFQVSDNCSAAANIDTVFSQTRINGTCANSYQLIRQWVITDECGNDTTIRQRINVIDTTKPRVVGIAPRDTTVSCSAVPAPATFQVSDNCSAAANIDTVFSQTRVNGTCANSYQLIRQWVITDECGNDTTIRQSINVIDTTNPRVVGIAPRDTTVSCSAVPAPATFQVSDNCSAAANIDTIFTQTRINGTCANSYQLIRQWVITDECGNDTIIRQQINVIDTTNPRVVGIAPRDTTVSCSAIPAPATFQVSDNCSAAANIDTTFRQTRINGSCANTYQLVREWTITDECGNDTIIRQRINVIDTTNPRVVGIAPRDTMVSCNAVPAPATFQVSDNCSAAANIDTVFSQTRINGSCANSYQLIRQWVITDECGNDTIIRQRINVIDTTNPRVAGIAPRDTTVSCSAIPVPATFQVSDNCSAAANIDTTFRQTRINGTCANTYQLVREWTLRDECGNDTIIRQLINVIDTTNPRVVGIAPRDTTVSCSAIPVPATFQVSDNCSAAANIDTTFRQTRINGTCANTYQLVREWTLRDECGNDTIIRQRIDVIDTTNPRVVGIAPRDTTVSCSAIPAPATFQVSDNCSAAANIDTTFRQTRINGSCANTYQLVREWTLRDECGNDTIIRQRINVIDTTNPRVVGIAPRDTTVSCSAIPAPATFQVSDNCSVAANIDTVFSQTRINGACANSYQLIRQWVITDECGNDTIIRQRINVIDTTNPRVVGIAPRDTTVSCNAVPAPATFQVSDNCSIAANIDTVFSQTRINGACANSYQLIRQWVITDECGNDTIIRQRINVIDTTNPRVVGIAPRDTTVSCNAVPAPATFRVSDNCSIAANIDTVFSQTRINGSCANTYQLIRQWIITDECGNDTIIRQRINVIDTTNPRVVGIAPRDTTVSCSAIPVPATFQVSDNCSAAANIDTTFRQTRINGSCANTYQLVREWTLRDECGNDTIIRQRINVIDTTNPRVVGIAPRDTTVSCNAVPAPATFRVSDNCSVAANIDTTFRQTRINGACANTYQLIREWTLRDECGNDTIIRQRINVIDTTNPRVVGIAPRDTTVSCNAVPAPATFRVSDNCSAAANIDTTFRQTRINGACANSYQLIREWTLRDECGNDTIIRQRINVIDTTNPRVVGIAPRDTIVSCNAVPAPATFRVSDNCSAAANIDTTFRQTRINGACANSYQLIREWTLRDECGNDTIIRQRINVIDTTNPRVVGIAPRDTTVSCNAVPAPATFRVSDNCSAAANIDTTFRQTRINGSCANSYQLIREWTLRDECGNDTIIRQRINVIDTTNPRVVGIAPRDTTVSCNAVPAPATFPVSDNCSTAANIDTTFRQTRINGACANSYQLIREWTLRDECGNDTIIRQRINVIDTTRPRVVGLAPRDTTVSCDAIPVPATFPVADNCSAAANIDTTFRQTRINGTCANTYQLVREWTLTDECGNNTVIRQRINVIDTTLPRFVLPLPANMTVECDNITPQGDLNATDNCSRNVTVVKNETKQPLPGRCVNNYLIIRTWTAIDDCNNTITHTQTITVIDTTAPVFATIPPANITVACDSVPAQQDIRATDNCSSANGVTVTKSQVRINGSCANSYQLIRTWRATDECGNTRTITQTVNVRDIVAPVFTTRPTDTTVSCDAVPAQPVPRATDNCSTPANIAITPTETRVNGTCANSYQLIRTWTATDECGNRTQWTQRVTVEDRAKPVFFTPTPRDTTVNCDAIPAPPVMRAKDNCTDTARVNIAYTQEHIDITGACANNYRLLRRWTATDECGNATTVIQVIDVRDTTRPRFVSAAPADTIVNCDAIPTQPNINVTDNCSVTANIQVVRAERRENIPGACVNNYRIIRTWTAADECNNSTVLTQVITVQDTTRPVFTMPTPANITVECNAIPTQPMLTAADNCSSGAGVTVIRGERMEQIPGAVCTSNYRLIRTWIATDQCGNQSTVTQTITVVDTTAPTFTMSTPADVTVECNAIPAQPNLTATDNCTPSNNVTIVKNERREDIPGACVNNYRLIRTWTARDLCGNEATVQQMITVRDITAPTFTQSVPADATVECSAIPVMPNLQVTDNCTSTNNITIVKDERREDIPGACVNNYRLIRTWTATDECGNRRSVQQVLTVVDNTPPTFTVATPANATAECNAIPVMIDLAARDNCSTNPISIVKNERREDIPGACANNYRLIRTWTATDECGNSTTVTQTLTVVDRTAPTFSMPVPADVTVDCDAIPTQPDLTAADNCSFANSIRIVKNETRENIPGACINSYRLIRTWTATDECGNSSTVRQVVTVQDRTAPVFTMVPPANITVNCHEVPAAPVLTATDNCSGNNVTVTYSFRKQILSATCVNNYRLTRTWTATDECGNRAVATQIVTVIDTTGPIFNAPVPSDTTVSCEAIPAPVIVTASDNCSRPGSVRVTHRQVKETIPGACTGNYRLINIWTARDECGNTSELRQVITVVDTTRPVIATPPADITISCGALVPTGDVKLMATDNCDPAFPKFVSYTTDPFVRDICNGYTITRRWRVSDACGNAAQEVTQRIIVLPCPKPELEADVMVNCSSNPFITLKTNGRVNRPVYTLVGVTPANAVPVPMTSSNPRFNVNGATTASFIVRDGATGCASDTMTYTINYLQMPVVNLGNDTSLCGGNGMVLDAGAANFGYQIQWSTGETTQRIRVTQPGTYKVTVSNGMCTATDEIKVGVIPMPLVNLPDTTICRGQNVILNASVEGASYLWSTGATSPSINVSTHEQFWVRVTKNGCITIDTINVTVNPPPDISLSRDTSICPGQSVLLTVNTNAGRIQWGTGEIGNSILVSRAGNYSVSVYRDNCVVREIVRVTERPDMKFELGPDRIICPGGSILVDARHPDASTYRWNDGDLSPVKSISQGGKYVLGVLDRYCDRYKQDSFNVIVAGPPTVNLGNDTIICKGRRFMLKSNAVNATSYLWSNGQTSSSIEVTQPGTYSVTAFNDCGSTTDEITIDVKECDSRPDFPNAFSPNGDGNNDVFRPVIRGPMYDYELRIFNRWGELVFISKDMHHGWNGWYKGRPVDIGTFVWWMSYKKVINGPSFIIKGDVTVIR